MKNKGRITTGGGGDLHQTPFEKLDTKSYSPPAGRPQAGESRRTPVARRVDIRREKSGRGGKTVTVVAGLAFLNPGDRESLAKRLRRELGTGGAVKGTAIELQGDQREKLPERLRAEGFRPVLSGG